MDAFDFKFQSFDINISYSFMLHYNLLPSLVLISLCLTLNQVYLPKETYSQLFKEFQVRGALETCALFCFY